MMNFDKFTYRPYRGHPLYSYVSIFYKVKDGNKLILTKHFANDFNIIPKNVIIASSNDLIIKEICYNFACINDSQWITVSKHISDVLRMDMVLLMNTYCNIINKKQYWDLYYYTPKQHNILDCKTMILFDEYSENYEDDDDPSLKP